MSVTFLRINSMICLLITLIYGNPGICQHTSNSKLLLKNRIHLAPSLSAYNFTFQQPHSYDVLGNFQFSYTRRLTPRFALKTEYDRNYGSYEISGLHLVNYHLISLQATYQVANPVCFPDPLNFIIGGGFTYRHGSEWLFWKNHYAHTFRRNSLGIATSFTPTWNLNNWFHCGFGFKSIYFPNAAGTTISLEDGIGEIQQTKWIFQTLSFLQFSF